MRRQAQDLRPSVAELLEAMQQFTLSSAARRSLSKAVNDDGAGQILRASIGAHADDFEPVPDENREDLARYALLLAYADDLAEDGYTDPRSV